MVVNDKINIYIAHTIAFNQEYVIQITHVKYSIGTRRINTLYYNQWMAI